MRRVGWLLGALLQLGACQVGQALEPPQGGLQRMIEQPRYEAFEGSRFFDDQLAMRHPPAGTVPFLDGPLPAAVLESGLESGAPAAVVPLPVTRELLEVGRYHYDIVCATCHGLAGTGDSAVARNMVRRPPPSLVAPPVRGYSPGRLYRVIAEGYGLMPAYAAQLTVEQRWAVVSYLEALQLSQRTPVDALPESLQRALSREAP